MSVNSDGRSGATSISSKEARSGTPSDDHTSCACGPGSATITGEYKGRTAQASFVVIQPTSNKPVATVTVSPASLSVFAATDITSLRRAPDR